MPGLPVHHQLPEFTQIHVLRVSDAIQLSHPLLSPSSPAPIPPSIRVFSNKSTLHMRWLKYWSFSFSIIPSKEIPGLISFRMDWLGLLAVQRTLKSLLQHHSSKASILRGSALVQLSHPIYSFSDSFPFIDYYKILNIVPVLYRKSLLFISFLCSHVNIFRPIHSFTHSFIHSKLLPKACYQKAS